jgi:hypothetical protein
MSSYDAVTGTMDMTKLTYGFSIFFLPKYTQHYRPYIMYILTGQTQDVIYIPLAYEAAGGKTHFEDQ